MSKIYWEDFSLGPREPFGPRLITRDEIIDFAREFDPQPMHLDDEAAKQTMLGGLSASGWHVCSLVMRMAADSFILDAASMGGPGIDEVKWLKPVRPGDELTLKTTVTEMRPSNSRPEMGFVRYLFEMVNQNGETVATVECPNMIERRPKAAAYSTASDEIRP